MESFAPKIIVTEIAGAQSTKTVIESVKQADLTVITCKKCPFSVLRTQRFQHQQPREVELTLFSQNMLKTQNRETTNRLATKMATSCVT